MNAQPILSNLFISSERILLLYIFCIHISRKYIVAKKELKELHKKEYNKPGWSSNTCTSKRDYANTQMNIPERNL